MPYQDCQQFQTLEELQRHLSSFKDEKEREIAEMGFFAGQADSGAPTVPHILVFLHGMNTNGEWQEALAEPLRNGRDLIPIVLGYGDLNPFKFWMPVIFRRKPILHIARELRNIARRYPGAKISVIAHSFGTYIISKILLNESDINFFRVIFCGAVVKTDYRWDQVESKIGKAPVVNDIGAKDFYPSFAKRWSWGYGDSGSFGFKQSFVYDRHFSYGHSDFLNDSHMSQYWIPFLIDGRIVPSSFTLERKAISWKENVIRSFSWSWLIFLALSLIFIFRSF